VRAHVVALKDGCESVVLRVKALVSPIGVERSSRGRKSVTRAACAARGVRSGGRTRARRPRCLATCVTEARAEVVANRRVTGVGERESTGGTRMRVPDDLVLHLVYREGVTIVNVGEKLFVRFLMAGGFGEVQAHESNEGVDVLDCHGLHVAELKGRGVDRVDVVKSRSHGVILETETRLEATSEELVRDRCTGDWVHQENFRQHRCTTVRRVDLDFRKHFVEGCERFCLFLEEPPKPVLKHCVQDFAVAGEP
jgi:hypothetical protein